jgi:hypothetical protein
MTYEIEIIEPRARQLLEELVNLNLIKFITVKHSSNDTSMDELPPTQEEIKAAWGDNAREVAAAIRGEKPLRSAYDLLAELQATQTTAL